MYCYKLNNSYTVYVNHIYINECIKAGKKAAQEKEDMRKFFANLKPAVTSQNVKNNGHIKAANNPNL